MFFIVSKLLAFLITPITWIIGLLCYSFFTDHPGRKKKSMGIALVMLIFFSNAFIFDEAMRMWEIPATADADLNVKYDAGIVLGGILSFDQLKDRLQFNRRSDRLIQAVLLYKKGIIKKIFFSGGSGSIEHPEIKEGPFVSAYLTGIGIPDKDILIESESNNTHENGLFSKPILDANFASGKFLLITSAFHMRRSMGCFRKSGIVVTAYSTDRYSGKRKFVFDHVFIPRAETLFNWESLLHEIVGYLTYRLVGYA